MTDLPAWIEPGETATLIWYDAVGGRADGFRIYQIAGPLLERPPHSPYFLLAPAGEGAFGSRLYRGLVTLAELRRFLSGCTLAEGRMDGSLETVVTRAEVPALAVLDAWRALPDRPLLPYLADISAFLPRDLPVYVSPEAYTAARSAAETFERAWVCAECGDAEDMSVFLWTAHREQNVRVFLLIENESGRWTCHLHPFEFEKKAE
jgi:hypothetical protein